MTAASKSLQECTASEIILILPDKKPARNLKRIRIKFEITVSDAASCLFCKKFFILFTAIKDIAGLGNRRRICVHNFVGLIAFVKFFFYFLSDFVQSLEIFLLLSFDF